MRISDWSSDVCSSDLANRTQSDYNDVYPFIHGVALCLLVACISSRFAARSKYDGHRDHDIVVPTRMNAIVAGASPLFRHACLFPCCTATSPACSSTSVPSSSRSEEHTSELQSLMRITSA